MGRFVEGLNRTQTMLFRECLDDRLDEGDPVRVIDAFADAIDLDKRGSTASCPRRRARPDASALLDRRLPGLPLPHPVTEPSNTAATAPGALAGKEAIKPGKPTRHGRHRNRDGRRPRRSVFTRPRC